MLSIFVFASGLGIYILFRDMSGMAFLSWLPENSVFKTVYIRLEPSVISYILKYNIPDMLWFVSGIMLLRFIWFTMYREQKIYVLCFYIMGVVFEFSQLSAKIPGTFDWMDLLFMGIGAFVEGLLYYYFIRRRFA